MRWSFGSRSDEVDEVRRTRWLVVIVYLLALTLTNHLMGLLVGPALLVYLWRDGRVWPTPGERPLALREEEIDALPPGIPVAETRVFEVGTLRARIEPRVLTRADILVLSLIRDNFGERPFYFSRTVGSYPDNLGFSPYLLGEGLARKVMPEPVRATPDIVPMPPPLRWVDLPRTETLLFDVYHYEAVARERPRGWVDTPSEGIMSLYALLYAAYVDPMEQQSTSTTEVDSASVARAALAAELSERIIAQTSFGNSGTP